MGSTTLGIASLSMGLLPGVSQVQQQSRQTKAQANALKQQAHARQIEGDPLEFIFDGEDLVPFLAVTNAVELADMGESQE